MRAVASLALSALLLGGCGGGGSSGPTASLTIYDTNADVRPTGADTFVLGEDGMALALGDDVRTDATGFAQVTYADGSLTRLDRETEVRVVLLAEAADAAQVQVKVDAGRVWNRVQELGAEGSFEVEGSVATAAVRGTAFEVDCAFGCLFRVLDGQVEVTPTNGQAVVVAAGQALQVRADGTPGPLLGLGLLANDAWLARNLEADGQAGFADIAQGPGADTSQAGIGGTWDVRFVATDQGNDPDAPPNSSSDVTFTIATSCDAGPCDSTIDAGPAGTFDVLFDGTTFVIDDTEQTTTVECQPQPVFDRRVTGVLTVSAVVTDDLQRAAVFSGTVREEFAPLPDAVAAGCAPEGVRVRDSVVRGVLRP